MEGGNGRVCVTGASGYLGSWLVMRLLQRGYSVRGTVRSLEDKSKTEHLLSLPEAKEKLELVEADLLVYSSIPAAVKGCDGVFAVAVPILDPSKDQSGMIELAMTSTMNLLRACDESHCVKRVVMTSTYYSAIQVPHEGEIPFEVDESSWTSVEYCMQQKMSCWGYMVAKTLAEKAAFEYAKEKEFDLISILPSLVGGAFLTPSVPGSVALYLGAMTDVATWMSSLLGYMSYVHVDDTIQAHILLMEDSHAKGRYLCSAVDATLDDVLHEVLPLLKSFNIPPPKVAASLDEDPTKAYYKINTTKLKDMGFTYEFDTLQKIFKDSVLFFLEKGHLKQVQ
uniref:Dihydroflavonol 4-reductase n=1 Tax=Dryopteris erythrosora TaxID=239562 RepID=A0A5P8I1X8_9MONI|nr:dihydroflavonol 4-reductase [Dryopteris erythrosora]